MKRIPSEKELNRLVEVGNLITAKVKEAGLTPAEAAAGMSLLLGRVMNDSDPTTRIVKHYLLSMAQQLIMADPNEMSPQVHI